MFTYLFAVLLTIAGVVVHVGGGENSAYFMSTVGIIFLVWGDLRDKINELKR